MIRRPSSTLAGLIALAVPIALLPTAAMSDCDLLRKFNAVQANGFNVIFELDDVVNGQARGSAHYLAGSDLGQVNGQADGSFDGLSLTIDVHWQNGSVGHYEGRIDPASGRLAGATKDLGSDPSGFQAKANWVKWSSKQHFACVPGPGVSPSTIAASCGEYAKTAVQQNEQNIALRCGFTDARWNSNQADHENWCQGVGPDAAAKHTAARKAALDKCRYAIAHPVNPTDKLGIEETPKPVNPIDKQGVFEKPGAGVGDILKEVQPPASEESTPKPGGVGDVFRQ